MSGKISIAEASNLLEHFVDATSKRNIVPAGADSILKEWIAEVKTPSQSDLMRFQQTAVTAVGRWSLGSLVPWAIGWLDSASPEDPLAISAIDGLGSMNDPKVIEKLKGLAKDPTKSIPLRTSGIRALAKHDLGTAASLCAAALAGSKENATGGYGIVSIASRQGGPEALIQQLGEKIEIVPDAARAAIEAIQGASIQRADLIEALQKAGRLSDHRWILTPEFSKQLASLVQSEGNPQRGEQIYRNAALQCSRCHPIGTSGGQIGPNLISLGGSSQLDYIIESILVPEAKLKEGFQTIVALTEDGEVISGLERSRTEQTLSLLNADGKVVDIPRNSIEEERTGKSLMPSALADTLSLNQLADLVRFLSELGRTPSYTIGTEPWVRRWDALKYTDKGHVLLNRTSLDSLATDTEILTWQPIVTRVDGLVPMAELAAHRPHANMKPFAAVRAEFDCKKSGQAKIDIQGTKQYLTWLDGKPIDLVATSGIVQITEGKHIMILSVQQEATEAFGVRVLGDGPQAAVIDLNR